MRTIAHPSLIPLNVYKAILGLELLQKYAFVLVMFIQGTTTRKHHTDICGLHLCPVT